MMPRAYPDPLFPTQEGMPHLLEHLMAKYVAHLEDRLTLLRTATPPMRPMPYDTGEEAARKAPLADFLKFATTYLTENRVVENFFVDANHGVVLSDNSRLVLCPVVDLSGTMQESGAVSVTHGRSQPGNEGVIPTESRPVR